MIFSSSFVGLINNAALLLALAVLYDILGLRFQGEKSNIQQFYAGLILGAVGIAIMVNPWEFGQGISFDLRSVLLCLTGFFFGTVPVVLAVLMTGAFRLLLGGAGAWTGVAVIVSSGGIGLAWRYFRRDRKEYPTTGELYLLGIAVHVVMLVWMLSLPWKVAVDVLAKISLPVMLICPAVTAILGKLMVIRERRRQPEEALKKSEEKFRNIFQYHSAIKMLIDPVKGNIVEANEAAEKFYGWSAAELKRMRIQEINTLSPDRVKEKMEQALHLKRTHFEFRHRLADGSIRDVEVNSSMVEIEGEKYLHSIIHDITGRRLAEKALEESEKILRTVFDGITDGILVINTETRKFVFANQAICRMLGYSLNEMLSLGLADIHPEKDLPYVKEQFERQLSGEISLAADLPVKRKDGSIFSADINSKPIEIEGQSCLVGLFRDTTPYKMAEKALRESEERYRAAFDLAPVGVAHLNPEGRYILVNQSFCQMLGYSRQELEKLTAYDVTHPDDRETAHAWNKKIIDGEVNGHSREKRYLHKDGSTVWAHIAVSAVWDSSGRLKYVIGVVQDITERKLARDALEESEIRYRRLFEAARDGILILDAEIGVIVDVNPYLVEILGISREQFLGRTIWELGFFKDIAANQSKFEELRSKQYIRYENLPLENIDGLQIDVEFVSNVYEVKGRKVIQCNIRDVGERKRVEKEKANLEDQLRRVQKLEAVGTLAGGIAHDFNNILSAQLGYTHLALEDAQGNPQLEEFLERALQAGRRATSLVKQILSFSRQAEQELRPIRVSNGGPGGFGAAQGQHPNHH